MLTKLTIRNFKRFDFVEVELGNPVVFIGPNNSGKTTALQALALWDIGLRRWNEKRRGEKAPTKRPGVAINRRELVALPVPAANLLWRDLHVRDVQTAGGKQETKNVRIDITVEGVTGNKQWKCGLEFDYANEESFYCRPLRLDETRNPKRMEIPEAAAGINVAFLPPMSGLAANETSLPAGAINVRIGEGRTAEVLRNLCYGLATDEESPKRWKALCEQIRHLFGVQLENPRSIPERGEITMGYREKSGKPLDLSCSGRGVQQTLLLLAYLYGHPNSVLLLDEPDAHLEILRQRQIYQVLAEAARTHNSQIVAASHSEVLLNEAAERDVVIAFVGNPHRIDDRGKEVLKSLKEIGFDQYYQAEQKGWVLYLEGATDLAILREFAGKLTHEAESELENSFVHYVQDQPERARRHFNGLKEAIPGLVGCALFDRIDKELRPQPGLRERKWRRREIENYLCQPETLLAFAEHSGRKHVDEELLELERDPRFGQVMDSCITDLVPPVALRDRSDPWWANIKASSEFLDRVFEKFYEQLQLPNLLRKTRYHVLARYVPEELLDDEIRTVLDMILETARQAKPLGET